MSASKSKKNVVISAEDLMRPYVITPTLEVKSAEKASSPFTTVSTPLASPSAALPSAALPSAAPAAAPQSLAPPAQQPVDIKKDVKEDVKVADVVGLKNSEKLEKGEDIEVCYDIKNKKIIFVSTKGRLIVALHVPELNGDVDKMVRYGSIKHREFRSKYIV